MVIKIYHFQSLYKCIKGMLNIMKELSIYQSAQLFLNTIPK